jgi:hypothetical protein
MVLPAYQLPGFFAMDCKLKNCNLKKYKRKIFKLKRIFSQKYWKLLLTIKKKNKGYCFRFWHALVITTFLVSGSGCITLKMMGKLEVSGPAILGIATDSGFTSIAPTASLSSILESNTLFDATTSALLTSLSELPSSTQELIESISQEEVAGSAVLQQQKIKGLKQKPKLASTKKHFKAGSALEVELGDYVSSELTLTVKDARGKEVAVSVAEVNGKLRVTPPEHFRPGKHTLTVESSGEVVYQQDFTWGVLAINTNKSIYSPAERAFFSIAVLNESGDMVCDADVTLSIQDPNGEVDHLTTRSGTIKVNPECRLHDFSLIPDYEADYLTGNEGTYQLELTAVTQNGSYTITDSFEVREDILFDVERVTATRIYPPKEYPVTLYITVNEDFSGVVEERVPLSFVISEAIKSRKHDTTIVDGDNRVIQWNLSLKKGETATLGYYFDAPDISPEFYLLGPLTFKESQKTVFEEVRQWQIAADSVTTPTSPGTGGNDATVGTQEWVSTSNITTSNNSYASVSLAKEAISNYLTATDFGFSIPTTATIDGIVVEVERYATNSVVNDSSIKIIKGGSVVGNEKSTGASWQTSDNDTYVSFGGSADLWGTTWTAADINASNFGVAISAVNNKSGPPETYSAYVDHVRITVYYTPTEADISVLGTIYTDEDMSAYDCSTNNITVSLKVNGLGSYTTTCTEANGNYSFSTVTVGPNDTLTVFLDEETEKAVAVTRAASTPSNISNLHLYQNRVVVRHEDTGPVTINDLDEFDKNEDADIPFMASSDSISFDNSTSYIINTNTGSFSFSHAVGSSSKRLLLVSLAFGESTWQTTPTVTYAGQTMTLLRRKDSANSSVAIWYLVNPSSGTNTVQVSGFALVNDDFIAGAVSFSGVDHSTPLGTYAEASGTGDAISVNVSSATGEIVFDAVSTYLGSSLTPGANQTSHWSQLQGARLGASSRESGASTTTMSWTGSGVNNWAIIAVPIKPSMTSDAVFDSGIELHIDTGATFTPQGNVSVDTLHVKGTYAGAAETLGLNGAGVSATCSSGPGTMRPLCIDGGTYTAPEIVKYKTTVGSTTIEGTTYKNLEIGTEADSSQGVTFTLAGNTTVGNVLTLGNATSTDTDTLEALSYTLTLQGTGTPFNVTSKGSFSAGSSTVVYTGSNSNISGLTYNNLTVGAAGSGAPQYDNATTAVQNSGSSMSFSHTVSGSSRLLIVAPSYRASSVLSVTYGGNSLTKIRNDVSPDSDRRTDLWYLLNPPTGSNSVAITFSGDAADVVGAAISFTGVNQSTPLGNNNGAVGSDTSPTVSLSSSTNEVVLANLAIYPNGGNNVATANIGQDVRWSANTTYNNIHGAGSTKTGSSSTTIGWTTTQAFGWSVSAVGIRGNSATAHTLGSSSSQTLTANNINIIGIVDSTTYNPTVTIAGNFSLDVGAAYTASATNPLTIGGNFTNNGTFTSNSGTVVFNDNSKPSSLEYSAATTFTNFSCTTGGKQLYFDETEQTNVSGLFTITGSDCTTGRIFLDSTTDNDQWDINVTGTADIDYADVEDSNAVTALTSNSSTEDNGGNTNWTINADGCQPLSLTQASYRWSNDDGEELHYDSISWYDTNWGYRVPITVTNNVTSSLTDYQVAVSLDTATLVTAGKMQNNCADIRVTDADKVTVLNHWIETGCNTSTTKIWTKIPSLSASESKTIYVYYGNETAPSTTSISSTFLLGDDFNDGTLDTNIWTTSATGTGAYVNESDGYANIHTNAISNTTADLISTTAYGPEVAMRFSARISAGQLYDHKALGFLNTNVGYDINALDDSTTYRTQDGDIYVSNSTSTGVYQDTRLEQSTYPSYSGSFKTWEILWQSSSVKYNFEEIAKATHVSYVPSVSITPRFSLNTYTIAPTNPLDINVDWIVVRKYAGTDPTTVAGSELSLASMATWKAAENTAVSSIPKNSNIRVRFSVSGTGSGDAGLRLQSAPKGGAASCEAVLSDSFTDIPTTAGTSAVVMTTSSYFTDQDLTTAQLNPSAGSFISGKMTEHPSNTTSNIRIEHETYTEVEYNFQFTDNASSGTTYCFRVIDGTTPLSTYTNVATATTEVTSNQSPSAPQTLYANNSTAQSGQPSPVYGLTDLTPAFSAIFDDPDTSDTAEYYQLQVGTDTDWATAEMWDSGKAVQTSCNEGSRCADVTYAGTALSAGSTYYWRIKFWDNSDAEGTWSETAQFSINGAPVVTSVSVNGGSNINLTANSTTPVEVTATVTDADGFGDISSAVGVLYRSGVPNAQNCTPSDSNCYEAANCTLSSCSDNSCEVTCTYNLAFYADPTDSTSSYAAQYWRGWVEATDSKAVTGAEFSPIDNPDVNSLRAITITSSISYGQLLEGEDTGSNNVTTTVTNVGNTLIDLELTGEDMTCTDPECSGSLILSDSQQFSLSNFTYGTGTALTNVPTIINIDLIKPTTSPSDSTSELYWGIRVPEGKTSGSYEGSTAVLATPDS